MPGNCLRLASNFGHASSNLFCDMSCTPSLKSARPFACASCASARRGKRPARRTIPIEMIRRTDNYVTLKRMAVVYASARDRLGQTLGGKYVLEDVFGVGGTAVVYRAKRPDGSVVALKMLHDYLCTSESVCRRFRREAYVANILEHPGTVRVLDDGVTDDGALYLVLEPLTGESVEERRLRFGGTLPVEEVLIIADQLLAVLEIAHAKNVVHRDIKPSNLFVNDALELKVLDFGIARILDDS